MVLPSSENGKLTPSIPIITNFGPDPWDSLPCKIVRMFLFLLLLIFLFCAAFGASMLLKGAVDFVALNFF